MKNIVKYGQHLVITLLIVFSVTGCESVTGQVAYQPPGIPLTISIDTNGNIVFAVEGKVTYPTPLGTFSAGVVVDPVKHFKIANTLTVRDNGKDYFYDLHGNDFNLNFESGYYRQINFRKDGSNLFLEVERINTSGPSVQPICSSWNLASDMRASPNQNNPNRDSCGNPNVWYFMQSSSLNRDPKTYSLLQAFIPNALNVWGLQGWQGTHMSSSPRDNLPMVEINTTGVAQQVLTIKWPPNAVAVHPYSTQLAIVGWRAPHGGSITISGAVSDIDYVCGDGIQWFVDKGSVSLASGSFANGESQNFWDGAGGNNLANISIAQGEFIYFIVHPNANERCDSTRLDVSITAVR